VDYETIKEKVVAGVEPSEAEIREAVEDQSKRLAVLTNELALHIAKLAASAYHPWPIPENQESRVFRRAMSTAHEHDRLTELYFWLELQANNIGVESGP